MSDAKEMFHTDADATHKTGNILKSGRNNTAASVLVSGQIFFDAFVDIRNIVGKRTIQYYQFNVKGIDNIVNGNGHIFYKKFCHMKCFRFLFLVFPEKGINGNVCSSG